MKLGQPQRGFWCNSGKRVEQHEEEKRYRGKREKQRLEQIAIKMK